MSLQLCGLNTARGSQSGGLRRLQARYTASGFQKVAQCFWQKQAASTLLRKLHRGPSNLKTILCCLWLLLLFLWQGLEAQPAKNALKTHGLQVKGVCLMPPVLLLAWLIGKAI